MGIEENEERLKSYVERGMGLNNIEVKRINRNNLLMHILQTDQFSKRSAATALQLSIPTVTQCLNDLINMGLAKEEGTMASIGGRRSVGYRCIKDARTAVGIDITRNHVNLVILDLAMNIIYSRRVKMSLHDTEASYQELKSLIGRTIEESGVDREHILGIGLSLPAIIGEDGRKINGMHEQMEISYDIYNIMKDWFPFPLHIENDANSAGFAEIKKRGFVNNAVYFFVSPSVGGAVIINGKSVYGQTRRTGEFGHMTLVPDGRLCYCGRKGCVNAYCTTELLSDLTDGNLKEFFEKLQDGDESCRSVWEDYLDSLALALHNLLSAFDMEIIIGGYLGQYIAPYRPDLEKRMKKLDPYLKNIDFIQPAILQYEASAIGAASIFVEKYLSAV